MTAVFPFTAVATIKYKSPHPTDLSFAKGESITVTALSQDDDDWYIGQSLDGQRTGGFPKDFVERVQDEPAVEDSGPVSQELPEAEAIPGSFPGEAGPQVEQLPPAPPTVIPVSEPTPAPPPATPVSKPAPASVAVTPVSNATPASKGDAPEPSKLSFKDRLAAFSNTPTKGPPPALKPKPAGGLTWSQRQKLKEEEDKKQGAQAPMEPVVPVNTPIVPPVVTVEKTSEDEKAGMSASDAKASIGQGLSLKERMAALAGSQAFGGVKTEEGEKKPPPKPWKRPDVPVGEENALPIPGQMPVPVRSNSMRSMEGQEPSNEVEQADEPEQDEKERRAAIAARMARLGGRGMFGGGPPALAPKPTSKPAEETAPVVTEQVAETVGGGTETAPGGGIAMPAIPRRAAGPKRRAGGPPSAPPRSDSLTTSQEMTRETPNAIGLVADEARQSNEETALEEDLGQTRGGAEGAQAAGIALSPPSPPPPQPFQQEEETIKGDVRKEEGPVLIGAIGGADALFRGRPSDDVMEEQGEIVPILPAPTLPAEAGFGNQEGAEEDQEEEDELLKQAKEGGMHLQPSRIDVEEGLPSQPEEAEETLKSPVGFVPIHSPAEEHSLGTRELGGNVTSPVRNTFAGLGIPKDEIELKHEHEAAGADGEREQGIGDDSEEEDGEAPAPPPRTERLPEKPSGPRPMPNPPLLGQTAQPEPSAGLVQARDEEFTPAPPPRRRGEAIGPARIGVPLPEGVPSEQLVSEPAIVVEEPKSMSSPEDADSTRRQNIAARMAKLGGIKFGGPPVGGFRQGSEPLSPGGPQSPRSPISEKSPHMAMPTLPESETGPVEEDVETEESAAARRRSTLARLQAGGRLGGFNMFSRNVEPESPGGAVPSSPLAQQQQQLPVIEERKLPDVPPTEVLDARVQVPVVDDDDEENVEDEMDAPPPPPRRSTMMSSPPQSPLVMPSSPGLHRSGTLGSMSSSMTGLLPQTTVGPTGLAPPIPVTTSYLSAEPQVIEGQEENEDEDDVGPPPPPRPAEVVAPPAPRRSESRASRISISSRTSNGPGSPTMDRKTSMQGSRPAFNELQQAANTFGVKVFRAAQKLAESGKRQSVGDGSSRAFVWNVMGDAGLDANTSFGTLIWEQEGQTQHKRYDDIRIGDVVVLHDAKLKGKKGLVPYTQQVGSVEEPMFAICTESEQKKIKIKVWQVERGHITSESYRLEDLQSGLVRVFRPSL